MAPAQPATPVQEDSQLSHRPRKRPPPPPRPLRGALGQMDQALTEDDQVVALTRMIRAYEQGLAALRDGLRRGIREQEIPRRLRRPPRPAEPGAGGDDRDAALARDRAAAASPDPRPRPARVILSSVAPGLETEARDMSEKLEEIRAVRAIQLSAANTLAQGRPMCRRRGGCWPRR